MSYRYRRIELRKGLLFWAARPVEVSRTDDGEAYEGMDLVPETEFGECWWRGFTRQHAIARAYRWAKRQNGRADRRDQSIESFEFDG